ncbi:delta(14)-sterol reductase isoform X1 [Ananas comosus]|uniref:Delta(14)-sterol reductase n=1 Tax=Ananas comosus TaxID=4615 RepID=A0A6P5F6X1_ANACO|nr:delta(14)-sterol reductase isoform X1 [Ananas comosus]XP_020089228.1 delta(14)-sterol reductase isoform X1 [Ananas comosus]XP_020089229.1 delta(14)-sterol reductase isoform X1 [Ananas comosus]XP_020089230.1 delta(14)-sterol reductase isoform X1 [Ananas comosus]XP_020089231.1 delta(14)-sterol reductase isoform X1 [Ananas comosus]XP_020089232.1 delta(14)-sterol reductase isoform X1 [Ananas comosus]
MQLDAAMLVAALIPSWSSVLLLASYLVYLAVAGTILPSKIVPGALLSDGSRLHYRCNGLVSLFLLLVLTATGVYMGWISPTAIADKGVELLSATFIFSLFVSFVLHAGGSRSHNQSSSLKPYVTGNFIHDWWFGVQLNPHFMGVDLKFFFVRAGMTAWLFINLSLLAKSYLAGTANLSVFLYQLFCALYIIDYFVHEEFMTSTWDIIAERLGFMLVFGDLVFIPFTFSIQGWWLLQNKVELPNVAAIASCLIFVVGYLVFRGANKQKHVFKKNPNAHIWGKRPKVVGGKLLASGYWGITRHCNYLGDLLLALSFSLPCGASSVIPFFYPIYLLILLVWRERRDEARCSQKYKEVWAEYCKLVPWRILPFVY